MLKHLFVLALCVLYVSAHAILRSPIPWNKDPSTSGPCGGNNVATTAAVTWAAGSKQKVEWEIVASDGAGPVTGLIDPAGGTNFKVAVPGLVAEASTGGGGTKHTYTITVPDVKCTGTGGTCTMQVKSSSNWFSCATLKITQPEPANQAGGKAQGTPTGNELVGNTTPVQGQLISTNMIIAVIIVPGIIMAPLIGLFVASVLDKTKSFGEKVDNTGSKIRDFFYNQALDEAGQFGVQVMRIAAASGLISALELIWAGIAAAYMAGPMSGVGVTAAVLVIVTSLFGFYAAYKREASLLLYYIVASFVTAAMQVAFLAMVFAYYASLAKLTTTQINGFTPITAIFSVMVLLQLVLLPLNLAANGSARKTRASLAFGGYQPTPVSYE